MAELDELISEAAPKTTSSNVFLIRDHYRDIGADVYSSERFMRLCAAWNETPQEMAARIGINDLLLARRLKAGGFGGNGTIAECILLNLHERFIRNLNTGAESTNELFLNPKPK